jgi:hypothetical protein
MTHLFGNPAIPKFRTRGFASPDFSGFALSEIFFLATGAKSCTHSYLARSVPVIIKFFKLPLTSRKYYQIGNFRRHSQRAFRWKQSDARCHGPQFFPDTSRKIKGYRPSATSGWNSLKPPCRNGNHAASFHQDAQFPTGLGKEWIPTPPFIPFGMPSGPEEFPFAGSANRSSFHWWEVMVGIVQDIRQFLAGTSGASALCESLAAGAGYFRADPSPPSGTGRPRVPRPFPR